MTSIDGDRSYSNLTSQKTIVAQKIISGSISTGMTNVNSIVANEGTIDTLTSTNSMIDTLNSINGVIDTLNSTTSIIDTLNLTNLNMPLGLVVQQTNTSTPVTINTSSGTISTFTSSVASGGSFSFQVINSKIRQESVILLSCFYGGLGTPNVRVETQSVGFCTIKVTNVGAIALEETVRINFLVINPITP